MTATTISTISTISGSGRRPRRVVLLAAGVAGAVALAACSSERELSSETVPAATAATAPPTAPPPPASTAPTVTQVSDEAEDAAAIHDNSAGYPDAGRESQADDGGGGHGGELAPFGDGGAAPVAGPCDEVLASGALLVGPDPAVLPAGTMSSALTITNCSGATVDWTAATVPSVAVANSAGSLGPASTSEIAFTIDSAAYDPGALTFKIKISEPGHNHYVDVHAFRELGGGDLVGDFGLSAGEGAGGCANQCIVTGTLTGNYSTPNVTLEVGLDAPAQISAWAAKQPFGEVDGHPDVSGAAPLGRSAAGQTTWSTTLAPLDPGTRYFLVVAATDEFGNSSYREGTFVTTSPVDQPDQLAPSDGPAGCSVQCISRAVVTPQSTSTDMDLRVETTVDAQLDVWVSTQAPDVSADEPTFGDGVDKVATTDGLSLTSWDAVIGRLTANTDYHIIVRAIDLQGRRSFRVGTFRTPDGPRIVIRFHSIEVERDGDPGGSNRGEISFRWGFDDIFVGSRGEAKIDSGTAFLLPDNPASTSFIATFDGGFLPRLYVSALERDADLVATESCILGAGVPHIAGHNDGCDARWNVASSGAILPADFDGMPRCSQFALEDVADLPCLTLVSPDHGDDYPLFWAVVSFEFLAD